MSHRLTDSTRAHLTRVAARAQRDNRIPGFVAGVAHRGELLWDAAVGSADLGDPSVGLGPDTQFPIASNTKTFVAALVMALRDEGRLALGDAVGDHLPVRAHAQVTIRQLLSHTGGIQREPPSDGAEPPPRDPPSTLREWDDAEQVLDAHDRWHYSNLAYMVLGEIVERVDGRPWAESLQARLLDPLQLRRTTVGLQPPHARQYYVPPDTDVPLVESLGPGTPAGALCSTLADVVRWHGFLLAGDDAILRADTLAEMRRPQMLVDPGWAQGYGLGTYLVRRDGRIWFGHTGGLPGAITAAFTDPESGITAVALANNSATRDPARIAIDLGAHVADHDPAPVTPWVPETAVPEALQALTGVWFSEGTPFRFAVRGGRLQARSTLAPDTEPPALFEPIGEDAFRTVSGHECGERLVVRRDGDGSVRELSWATYSFTREPRGFAVQQS